MLTTKSVNKSELEALAGVFKAKCSCDHAVTEQNAKGIGYVARQTRKGISDLHEKIVVLRLNLTALRLAEQEIKREISNTSDTRILNRHNGRLRSVKMQISVTVKQIKLIEEKCASEDHFLTKLEATLENQANTQAD